jgi:hypothetical protein
MAPLARSPPGLSAAISSEHQWHHLPGGPSPWAANEGWRTSGTDNGSSRRGLHAPGSVGFQALLFVGVTIFLLVATLNAYSGAQRSSYTPSAGERLALIRRKIHA